MPREIKVGSKVRYSRRFLRDISAHASRAALSMSGVVTENEDWGLTKIASIVWDDGRKSQARLDNLSMAYRRGQGHRGTGAAGGPLPARIRATTTLDGAHGANAARQMKDGRWFIRSRPPRQRPRSEEGRSS